MFCVLVWLWIIDSIWKIGEIFDVLFDVGCGVGDGCGVECGCCEDGGG